MDRPKQLAAQAPTILVEVYGGLVQNVEAVGDLPCPIRVLVRDHDNLKVDPEAGDDEWLLKPRQAREADSTRSLLERHLEKFDLPQE